MNGTAPGKLSDQKRGVEIIVAGGAGRLDVVATPIGNIGDLSTRAIESLKAADLVLAEDTRHTAALLAACGISRPLSSLHDHNESGRVATLLARLRRGEVLALVSDAGTPLLSDPGFVLVRAVAAAGLEVRTIPGPSAVTAALAVAGLPTDRFVFEGFLPARGGEREAALARLAAEARTLVLFRLRTASAGPCSKWQSPSEPSARQWWRAADQNIRDRLSRQPRVTGAARRAGQGLRARRDHDRGRGAAEAQGGDAQLLARALPLLLKTCRGARCGHCRTTLGRAARAPYEPALQLSVIRCRGRLEAVS